MASEPTPRLVIPSLVAGPAVIFFFISGQYVTNIPQPVAVGVGDIISIALLVPVSIVIGFLPALLCNAVGTMALIKAGNLFPLLRFPFVWPVVGGTVAWFVLRLLEWPAEWAFPFVAAAALSALLCRMRLA